MPIVALIPWLDILLLLVFVGLVALGFWQGLLRELWLLLSLYLAAVLASLYGDYIAGLVGAQLPEVGPATTGGSASSALGFFVVFAVGVIVLFTSWPRSLPACGWAPPCSGWTRWAGSPWG